jgi:hypothetical protein
VIDEGSSFAGQTLTFDRTVSRIVQISGSGEIILGTNTDTVSLPDVCGRLCLKVDSYF